MAEITGSALSAGSGESPRLVSAAFDWLARARKEPHHARREWTERGVTLLPLGERFNAVYLPARIVHAAAGTDALDPVTATLAKLLGGPVIHNNPQHAYYPLISKDPTLCWTYDETPLMGPGEFLNIPASDLLGPYGLYWAVPPRIVGDLCPTQSVAALVRIARNSLQGRLR